ncbi:MAG: F0F1 ATP synthase subunit B [Candidatus Omnitrophica bacterium]|nr:F0F1 ATP synthase subunit B [Candidatus Omnitrophota bacterium]
MSLFELSMLSARAAIAAEEAHAGEGPSLLPQMITVIVCFLIVYWILKRFAFGPILGVIDERAGKIESDLKRSEDARRQAEADRVEAEQRLRNIEEEARVKMQAMMADARELADAVRQKSHKDAADMLEKARKNIEYETEKAREVIKTDIVNLTVEAAEHLIKEKLDDEKHRQLIGDFISRIERN